MYACVYECSCVCVCVCCDCVQATVEAGFLFVDERGEAVVGTSTWNGGDRVFRFQPDNPLLDTTMYVYCVFVVCDLYLPG